MSQDEGQPNHYEGEDTPATQQPPSSSSILLSLPVELQLWIIDVCDVPSKLSLRMTNHHFRALVKRPTHAELLVAEKTRWAEDRDLFSCMDCLCLRPRSKFADAMTKGTKGKRGKESQKRFCLDCGLSPNPMTPRYSPGSEMKVGGKRFVLCKECRGYDLGGGSPGSGLCTDCWEDSDTWRKDDYSLEDFISDENFWEWYDPN